MANEATVKIGGSEQPTRDGEVHVNLHHKLTILMRRMTAPQRFHEGTVTQEPILVHVTAEVHKLMDELHAERRAHHQNAVVWKEQPRQNNPHGSYIKLITTIAYNGKNVARQSRCPLNRISLSAENL